MTITQRQARFGYGSVLVFALHFFVLVFGGLVIPVDAWLWLAALFICVTIPCAMRGIFLVAKSIGRDLNDPPYYRAYYLFRVGPRRFL